MPETLFQPSYYLMVHCALGLMVHCALSLLAQPATLVVGSGLLALAAHATGRPVGGLPGLGQARR